MFAFQAGKRSVYYLGSADLMPRNLDNRLEILAPVESTLIQQRLSGVFDVLLQDNFQAWDLRPDGTRRRSRPKKDETRRGTHEVLMRKAVRRSRLPPRALTR